MSGQNRGGGLRMAIPAETKNEPSVQTKVHLENKPPKRLSEIDTSWTELGLARTSVPESSVAAEARQALLDRYAGPVYQYLAACVRDESVADDLAQDFAVRFLDGRYSSADRDRGRFRDFLKRCLSNLATDYFRKNASEKRNLRKFAEDAPTPVVPEEEFDDIWRREVLHQTWSAFEKDQNASGSPLYIVLRHRAEFPQQSAADMANELSSTLNRDSLTEDWVRQTIHRARKKFSKLLREEVARTLGSPATDEIDEELAELGLLKYCDAG